MKRPLGLLAATVMTLLLFAPSAGAARYAVAQCGFRVGADADWSDSTGGQAFRHDAYCIAPEDQDPVEGTHLKSVTRAGVASVGPRELARWRWSAPAGAGIVAVRGAWWTVVHDGFQHRLGTGDGSGFEVFATAEATDTQISPFVAGFAAPRRTFESRLLCARELNRCSAAAASASAVRTLTITVEDPVAPAAAIGGDLIAPGWRRGPQSAAVTASDVGSGVRFSETFVDTARVAQTEHPCAKTMQSGEWRATRMRPCELQRSATQLVATVTLSDGPHTLYHCAEDFAGGRACTAPRQLFVDNNPPAAPRGLSVVGGDGWRRTNAYDVSWTNPDQGAASPIAAAGYRISGPSGFDSGVRYVAGQGINTVAGLALPAPGAYRLSVWLRDEAGNENPAWAADATLRFDDLPPRVAFNSRLDRDDPDAIHATIADDHSGPAGGTISYRRVGSPRWIELPTAIRGAELLARFPSSRLEPGRYALRVDAFDAAGNVATSDRRADGERMVVRAPLRIQTVVRARLAAAGERSDALRVPFGSAARLSGRLLDGEGGGLASRQVQVVVRPAQGSRRAAAIHSVRTGRLGRFRMALGPGPSRTVEVRFPGSENLAAATSGELKLAVAAGLSLRVSPRMLRTGEAIRIAGRVLARGARVPARGKLVQIQYYESVARSWRPVLITRSGVNGRFRARYRFRYISGTSRIRLRAAAPPESGWPYAFGASRPVDVTVRG